MRERFLPGGSTTANGFFYGYSFDPQGSTQARSSGTFNVNLPYPYSTVELYDGYGKFLYARNPTPGGMPLPYTPDPVGFGGQYGYYTDTETHLQSLTHLSNSHWCQEAVQPNSLARVLTPDIFQT